MASHFFFKLHLALLFFHFQSCLFLVAAESSTKQNIVTEREALISFKSQLLFSEESPLSSWDKDSTPCNWSGVFCNKPGTKVVKLDLSGLGLGGSISPHLGNLSFLRSLYLRNNKFSGRLPDELGKLLSLRLLNMSTNSIEGSIPPNISRCRELLVLDLMQNEISGKIPGELSRLGGLKVLNLGRNRLSGNIPPTISNLSQLAVLNLGTNGMGGMIPGDLALLRSLKILDLTINNFTGAVPPQIYNMSSLVSLALASNNLWGNIPFDVGVTLPNLLVFNFCINKFTGTVPGSLHNLTRIQVIRMAHNLLHGTVPPGLGNLPELKMYNIGYNRIVSSGDNGLSFLTSLTNSTSLNFLAIDGNLLQGVIPDSIGNLSKVLSKLYMGENRIYGAIPPSIGQLSGLQLLNLSYNLISGEIPQAIGMLDGLQMLGLAKNHLTGKIPNFLGDLHKLNSIDLSGNELVGSIPTTFRNFQDLLSMDLSNNRLNGSIPKEILDLPSLSTFLNLSNNFLTGSLPQEIGFLGRITSIDLANNLLTGSIPNSIEKCKSLQQFFAAGNMLSGNIPDTIGEVKGLEILDLSSNQLSGSIPQGLQELQALQLLNLSFNNLEGEAPAGGVFASPSKVHLEGNPKLCFPPSCKLNQRSKSILVWIIITVAAVLALSFAAGLFLCRRKTRATIMAAAAPDSLKGRHQMVSYDELRLATENFSQENVIGRGTFGCVYRGCLLSQGIEIAVKVLNMEIASSSWKGFSAECAALRNTRHRNLVKLITSCSSIDFKNQDFLALVYEFMSNGSLDDWIKGKRRKEGKYGFNAMDRLKAAIDVASAMNYLHQESTFPVVHCDLKPSNILLDEDMTAKVGDFGLARLLTKEDTCVHASISSTTGFKGTLGYIPPEYGMGEKPSTAGDVYSFGVVLLELFTGKSPTNEKFVGGFSLRKWVEMAFPAQLVQVLDPELLHVQACDLKEDGGDQSISPKTQLECALKIIEVALSCTLDSAAERPSMKIALGRLIGTRDGLKVKYR